MTVRPATFCPDCGHSLDSRQFEGRERRYCGDCDRLIFQQPVPAAGVAVVDGTDVLLVQRTGPPFAETWAIPAGIMEHDERPAETAARELEEEANVTVSPADLVLFDTWQHEHPEEDGRSITLGYAVSRAKTTGEPIAGSDAGAVRFERLEKRMGAELRPGEEERMHRAIEAVGND